MAAVLKRYAGPIAAALLILFIGTAMLIGWQKSLITAVMFHAPLRVDGVA